MKAHPLVLSIIVSLSCVANATDFDFSKTDKDTATAIVELRQAGQRGLDAILDTNPSLVAAMIKGEIALTDPKAHAFRAVVDTVARQRDAHTSRLYWYTDIDKAKAEARRTSRRILSLHLLGSLDQELSCANSRFFRTVLYANTEVSRHLREHYVLHWKSERPAPVITIDMGDGHRIQRTITGNSIHYVLNADGSVLDALPGLYGPRSFLRALEQCETVKDGDLQAMREWHSESAKRLRNQWIDEAVAAGLDRNMMLDTGSVKLNTIRLFSAGTNTSPAIGVALDELTSAVMPPAPGSSRPRFLLAQNPASWLFNPDVNLARPSAMMAGIRTGAKSAGERPILNLTMNENTSDLVAARAASLNGKQRTLADLMTPELWLKLADRFLDDARLDESSRLLMQAKLPRSDVTHRERAIGGVADADTTFARTLRRFEQSIAEDTARNEYQFHSHIHQWLGEETGESLRKDLAVLNQRIYDKLFLTPASDPWLGLVPTDTYSAIEEEVKTSVPAINASR